MKNASRVFIAVVAALHVYIAYFEIFAWTTIGADVFSTFEESFFPDTVDLAANQGVYNAFLAVGLIWSLFIADPEWRFKVAMLFLVFVAVAGVTAMVTISVSSGIPQLASSAVAILATVASHTGADDVDTNVLAQA